MKIRYYDRNGQPLDLLDWGKRLQLPDEKRVAETTLSDGTWISTVWLGLDHRFTEDGPPLIFETMVFPGNGQPRNELDCERYSTEAEAVAGHEAMVKKWQAIREQELLK